MYYIVELANTHGGDIAYLNELIETFEGLDTHAGMKFQAFSPDTIATPDFEWYPVYQELYFAPDQWKEILKKASKTKDIWLDIFDAYGVRILQENLDLVHGIKFQSSVLYNFEVMQELEQIDLSGKVLILNIAAQPKSAIREIIDRIENQLTPREIWLEIGFQAYPTTLADSGLNKIHEIASFGKKVVFADHIEGKSTDALTLPLIAATQGVQIIEKHVMLDTRETKYDHFSSITFQQYQELISRIRAYSEAFHAEFINQREQTYLDKSIMIPLLKAPKAAGELVNLTKDFSFRRSNQKGLNAREIEQKLKDRHILRTDKQAGEILKHADFKKATVATIIACRLKSSRLPEKALAKIGQLTSVELCISNALKFDNVNHTILATSTTDQDAQLKNYTYDSQVLFHTGDPDDVIQRYLDVTDKLNIDVVIRITADMPYVDREICDYLLKSHFASGADYTVARKAAVGTNLEIINVQALKRVKAYFTKAEYSEYMTWYFQNNPEFFDLNFVDLPEHLVRDYRMTLDYPEDLRFFNEIEDHFAAQKMPAFNLNDIYTFLDENPEIAAINQDCNTVYRTDDQLIRTLNEQTKMK